MLFLLLIVYDACLIYLIYMVWNKSIQIIQKKFFFGLISVKVKYFSFVYIVAIYVVIVYYVSFNTQYIFHVALIMYLNRQCLIAWYDNDVLHLTIVLSCIAMSCGLLMCCSGLTTKFVWEGKDAKMAEESLIMESKIEEV